MKITISLPELFLYGCVFSPTLCHLNCDETTHIHDLDNEGKPLRRPISSNTCNLNLFSSIGCIMMAKLFPKYTGKPCSYSLSLFFVNRGLWYASLFDKSTLVTFLENHTPPYHVVVLRG